MSSEKLLVFGGSFDPFHNGHVHMLKTVAERIKINRILLIPTYLSPQKSTSLLTPKQRLECLEACKSSFPGVDKDISYDCLDIEIKKKESYTIDSIRYILKQYNPEDLFLLIGSDQFFNFHTWKDYLDLIKLVKLCVVQRSTNNIIEYRNFLKRNIYPNPYKGVIIFNNEIMNISSTQIRSTIKQRHNIDNDVPLNIRDYLDKANIWKK